MEERIAREQSMIKPTMEMAPLLVGCALAVSPAFAEMPNPHVEGWADHRHMVIGADFEPQHFATAEISAPDSGSTVTVVITCENGARGSGWNGYFTVVFRQGENVLASTAEHCEVNRGSFELHQKKYSRAIRIDLSKVICRVDNVRTSITREPLPIKPAPDNPSVCEASADLGAHSGRTEQDRVDAAE